MSIHQNIMDEYVMMRFAQMIHEGLVNTSIDRAVNPKLRGGNIGGRMLEKNTAILKEALSVIKLEVAEPYNWVRDENGHIALE